MPRVKELDDLAVQAYYRSYRLARKCIVNSTAQLTKRNNNIKNISPGEVAENDDKILELTADKALLDAKKAAFNANKDTIKPPSTDQLNSLKNLIAKVDKLNANQRIIDEIVKLSTDTLTEFNKIHPN